ncbi:alpha/beta hydrolase [Burkholderia oklahomensis]|uniref:Alpha/beta hydrolase family protein n=1 Tax=Burkholderia oklahomensis TaxID=342113 RepID=A0AAI8BA25_9BURK|nr:alpha/beta hydrolase [Burkholderia oklahomensis]AIO68249.1 alpha/beta hydrolase family protein [Burkholderia oklahomensis]AOI43546.1 alpha/beta hydrolase [Burkholderia oklahomensis EO147]KUY49189.1 alpha/beta hydrolase [Burkholderia oklahomensis EO147]QPS38296.1 alpha/beta hydrolase [Burkholderia oklahomensis]
MRPIRFDDCLGWLHEGRTRRGAVICEALGHEALWTHKVVRALAERLADDGMWVLRFHYPSAGDSAGDDLAPGRLPASVASVRRALAVLRDSAPVDDVTLVGLRAGAAFAMLALAGDDAPAVDAFVALAPVVRGRAYLRELSVVQKRWLDTTPPAIREQHHEEPWLNILGHRYPADFVADLKQVDLNDAVAATIAPPRAALLVDTDYGDGPALRAALVARGVSTDVESFPEWPNALQEGARSRVPLAALESIARWIGRGERAAEPAAAVRDDLTAAAPASDEAIAIASRIAETAAAANAANAANASNATRAAHAVTKAPPPITFAFDGVAETLVYIGAKRLVGTLCEPVTPARAGTPCLLIANTAANPRSADGRIGVRLARTLAQRGIASLRVDIEGIGDSGARAPDDQSVVLYSDPAIADVAAAADWLGARCRRPVVAFGVCSGAFAALHAAAHAHATVGVIAVNLPRFIWPRGLTIAEARKQQTNSARGYFASMRDWDKWRRLLREGRDLRPVLSALRRHVTARLSEPAGRLAERLGRPPKHDTPRGLIKALTDRDVHTMLVYGEFDPGVDELSRYFGSPRRAFKRSPLVSVEMIRLLDHSVYGTSAAEMVIALCIDTLTGWEDKTRGPQPRIRPAGRRHGAPHSAAADAAASS